MLWKANDLDSKGGNYDSNMIQTNSHTVSIFYMLYTMIHVLTIGLTQPKTSGRMFTRHTLLQKGCQKKHVLAEFRINLHAT